MNWGGHNSAHNNYAYCILGNYMHIIISRATTKKTIQVIHLKKQTINKIRRNLKNVHIPLEK